MNDLSYEASLRARYAEARGRLWNAPAPVQPPSRVRTISLIPPPLVLPTIVWPKPAPPVRDLMIVSEGAAPDAEEAPPAPVTVPRASIIVAQVAIETGYSIAALKGGRRGKGLVQARHYLMWRLASETSLYMAQIGRLLHKDHTTILWGVKKHEERMRDGTALWGMGVKA